MQVAAIDETGEVRAVERVDHPFFVGTLYQPQLTTAPGRPHPIWRAFVAALAG
jgi:CTP synthase (UTP-ammonia lyase)